MERGSLVNKQSGFSLLEVMIVVAIIGIIASIVYPSYQESVAEARRADAQANLLSLSQHLERVFTESADYRGAALPYNTSPRDGGDVYYNISVPASTAVSYTLQATPVNAMAGDRCGNLTISNIGQRGAGGNDCWN